MEAAGCTELRLKKACLTELCSQLLLRPSDRTVVNFISVNELEKILASTVNFSARRLPLPSANEEYGGIECLFYQTNALRSVLSSADLTGQALRP